MTTTQLTPTPVFKGWDNNGRPLAFGLLYSYEAGTTTPTPTYTDSTGLTPNTNPVVLNARGEAPIWLNPTQGYKLNLTDSTGNQIPNWPVDNIIGPLNINQSLIPAADNTYDLGSISSAWRQLYLGANHSPALDTVSGIIGYIPRTPAEIAASVTPVNFAYEPGNVLRYGTNTTPGTTDMNAAANACSASNEFVYFPAGTYLLSGTVTIFDGQEIYSDSRSGCVINAPAATKTFKWAPAGSSGRQGPRFHDLTINSDYPITINNLTTLLANGSGDSPCQNFGAKRLILNAVTSGSGYGITASKMFDSEIAENQIYEYSIGVLINGSDINNIHDNRIAFFSMYGICEVNGQTFGSQNEIRHNDILAPTGTTATYIKSSSYQVRIYDNYMEEPSGTCAGFVDVTITGLPAIFGSNTQDPAFTINIRDNRIDGQSFGGFVYRIDPTDAVTIECVNVNTTANGGTSSFTNPVVPYPNPSAGILTRLEIGGSSWGIWDGYRSSGALRSNGSTLVITPEQIGCLINKDNTKLIQITGKAFLMPVAFTSNAWFVPAYDSVTNDLFATGVSYKCSILARTVSASGDTLQAARGDSAGGDSLNNFTLTQQFQRYEWSFSGAALTGHDDFGVYATRSTSNGDIEILSISFEMLENAMPTLPSTAPGSGSKQLYYDTADANRVKFVP